MPAKILVVEDDPKYSRVRVTILRREELEEAACECYETIRAEFSRLLGK